MEAVELWFRHDQPEGIVISIAQALLTLTLQDQWPDGMTWMGEKLLVLDLTGSERVQAKMGGWYLTMQYAPQMESVFFSIDGTF